MSLAWSAYWGTPVVAGHESAAAVYDPKPKSVRSSRPNLLGGLTLVKANGLSGADLAKPSGAAAIAHVLNLDRNIVGVIEVEFWGSQGTRWPPAIIGPLTPYD
jgi:hypothetical protein